MTIGPNNINRSIWYIKHGPWQGHKNEDAFWLILFGFILLFGSNYYWKEEPDFLKFFFIAGKLQTQVTLRKLQDNTGTLTTSINN